MRVYFCIPTLFFGGNGDGESPYLMGILLYTHELKDERARCRYHPAPPKKNTSLLSDAGILLYTHTIFGGSGDGEPPYLMGILLYTRILKEERERCHYLPHKQSPQ